MALGRRWTGSAPAHALRRAAPPCRHAAVNALLIPSMRVSDSRHRPLPVPQCCTRDHLKYRVLYVGFGFVYLVHVRWVWVRKPDNIKYLIAVMQEVARPRSAPEQRRRLVLLWLSALAAAVSFMRLWVLMWVLINCASVVRAEARPGFPRAVW